MDDGAYLCASDFDADVDLLVRNAEEYNPAHDARSRQIISAARDMRDKAHSMLHNFRKRIGYNMLEQCAAIARRRRGGGGNGGSGEAGESGETGEGAAAPSEGHGAGATPPGTGDGGRTAEGESESAAAAGSAGGAAARTAESAAERGVQSAGAEAGPGQGREAAPVAGPVLDLSKAARAVGEVARLCDDMASRLHGRSVGECNAVYHALLRLASASAGDTGVATHESADLLVQRLSAFVRALGRA